MTSQNHGVGGSYIITGAGRRVREDELPPVEPADKEDPVANPAGDQPADPEKPAAEPAGKKSATRKPRR